MSNLDAGYLDVQLTVTRARLERITEATKKLLAFAEMWQKGDCGKVGIAVWFSQLDVMSKTAIDEAKEAMKP